MGDVIARTGPEVTGRSQRRASTRVRRSPAGSSASDATSAARSTVEAAHTDLSQPEVQVYALSKAYLGGNRFWKVPIDTRSDVHTAIIRGVPYGSLLYFIDKMKGLDEQDVANVLGVSNLEPC